LDAFTAEAFLGDISLTSPLLPEELPNPDGLLDDELPGVDLPVDTINAVADYVRLQAIPAREPSDTGPGLFAAAGCAECHVPTLPTRADWPLDALAGVDAPLYTDGLLHDWGEAFSDGLPEGEATASEWRTAPLVGLRFFPAFLHDGRAASVEEAILLHTADAAFAVDRYSALSDSDRADLLSFVESL
jgi:CxxC motif-containing protein (DUF1111 family)